MLTSESIEGFSFSTFVETSTKLPSIDSERQQIISKWGLTGSLGGSPTATSFSQSIALSQEK